MVALTFFSIVFASLILNIFLHESLFDNCSTNSSIPLIDPLTIDIKTLQADLSSCRYSSVDLVRWYLDRIAMFNDRGTHPLHAVIETNPDVFEIAKALDFERQVNGSRSILHGIPILIKDSIGTDDKMQTTAGSYALVDARVPRDAFIVEKLRAAGAIILGKTSMSQWANVMTENVTRHGWSPRGGASSSAYVADGDPSGSSSGSAISTSAGLAAAAIGTETCGSIIFPSNVANIVGLKPTVGLTSRSGVIPISHDHDTIGPMGKSVEDVAILLETIQGLDNRDQATQREGIIRHENYTQFLRGVQGLEHMRLGVVRQGVHLNEEETKRFKQALDLMRVHGAEIIDPVNLTNFERFDVDRDVFPFVLFNFPHDLADYLSELQNTTIKSLRDVVEFNNQHQNLSFHRKYAPDQKIFLSALNFTNLTESTYPISLNKTIQLYGQNGIDATLDRHRLDALIIANATHDIISMAAVVGYPLMTVPLGFNATTNEPYGLLFAASAWSEPTLLRVAHGFEQAFPVRNTVRPKYAPFPIENKLV